MSSEVKNEPDESKTDEPEILSDPEDYLEQGESLDMNLNYGNRRIWLVKLPKYLATKWQDKQLMGQQLGKLKIKNDPGVSLNKREIKLVLNEENNEDIPKEYDLKILNGQVHNNYVFSEENLQRFKAENTIMSSDRPQEKEEVDEKPRRYNNYNNNYKANSNTANAIPFVKTIPKKTSLYGKINHDCQLMPSKSDLRASQFALRKQTIQPEKARPKVVLLDEIPGVSQSNAGPSFKGRGTSVFLKSSVNKNKNEGRAIRMPKKDLLDLLFRLFEEYEYWSIKGLRERTRQPESYLKESLDSIANLIKKGPYTSKYNLKPEYKKLRDAERAAKAGIVTGDDNENKQEEEDEDEDMEDVL